MCKLLRYIGLMIFTLLVLCPAQAQNTNIGGGGGSISATAASIGAVGPVCNVLSTTCYGTTITAAYGKSRCISNFVTTVSGCVNIKVTTDGITAAVTCASACATQADVGNNIWGEVAGLTNGTGTLTVAAGSKITAVNTGGTLISVSGGVPAASSSQMVIVIGKDDTAALASALAATTPSGTTYLPCGNYMVTSQPFLTASTQTNIMLKGENYQCTFVWFPMDFVYPASGNALVDELGSGFRMEDITFDGLEQSPNVSNKVLIIQSTVGEWRNIRVQGWFPQTSSNICMDGNSDNFLLWHPIVSCGGNSGIYIHSLKTDVYFPDVTSGCNGINFGEQATSMFGGSVGGAGAACPAVLVGGSQSNEVKIFGTQMQNNGSILLINGTNSTIKLFGTVFGPMPGQGDTTNTSSIEFGSTTATVWASQTRLYSTGTGFIIKMTSAGKFVDDGGNEATQNAGGGAWTGAGIGILSSNFPIALPVITGTGACASPVQTGTSPFSGSNTCPGSSGSATLTFTWPASAINKYICPLPQDVTTGADVFTFTSSSSTACVYAAAAIVSGDVITWGVVGQY